MGVRLANEGVPRGIWAGDMKDGDIAVIVGCAVSHYIGRIVQRYDDSLIGVGTHCKWNHVFSLPNSFRVRVLEKGEILVIT